MTNNILYHPQIRQKREQRKYYKNKYKIVIEKNETNRNIALNNYRNSQIELKRTIEHHITKNKQTKKNINNNNNNKKETGKRLKTIVQQGFNSKQFWNIVRQRKRNNSENLIAIRAEKTK